MATLPKHIQVLYNRYKVKTKRELRDGDGEKLVGLILHDDSIIWIEECQAAGPMAETVLHEVLHACWDKTTLSLLPSTDSDVEEMIVKSLTPVLLDTLQRNPELVDYLLEGGS